MDEAWHNEIADTDLPLYKIIDASQYSHGSGMKSYLIMMAVRLKEMKRILKPTGSIYLHCDALPTSYLKDDDGQHFRTRRFSRGIQWKRTRAHNGLVFGIALSDTIFSLQARKFTLIQYPGSRSQLCEEVRTTVIETQARSSTVVEI